LASNSKLPKASNYHTRRKYKHKGVIGETIDLVVSLFLSLFQIKYNLSRSEIAKLSTDRNAFA